MKKNSKTIRNWLLQLAIATGITLSLGSCNVYIAPKFTDVEKIVALKSGMSIGQINSTLGIEPYDIYHIQESGATLISYNYRVKERRIKIPTLNANEFERKTTNEASQTAGEVKYDKNYKALFVLIKEGRLVSMITSSGRAESEYILVNANNIQVISEKNLTQFNDKPLEIIPLGKRAKVLWSKKKVYNSDQVAPSNSDSYIINVPK